MEALECLEPGDYVYHLATREWCRIFGIIASSVLVIQQGVLMYYSEAAFVAAFRLGFSPANQWPVAS